MFKKLLFHSVEMKNRNYVWGTTLPSPKVGQFSKTTKWDSPWATSLARLLFLSRQSIFFSFKHNLYIISPLSRYQKEIISFVKKYIISLLSIFLILCIKYLERLKFNSLLFYHVLPLKKKNYIIFLSHTSIISYILTTNQNLIINVNHNLSYIS